MWNNLFLIYIEKVTWIELIQQTAQLILYYIKYINGDLLCMARTNKTFSEKKSNSVVRRLFQVRLTGAETFNSYWEKHSVFELSFFLFFYQLLL